MSSARFILVVIMFTFVGLGAYIGYASSANFQDPSEYAKTPEEAAILSQWYKSVRMNNDKTSCCGVADAYYADVKGFVTGGTLVEVNDDRQVPNRIPRNKTQLIIPNELIDQLHQGNPTGRTVVFLNADREPKIYCFFPLIDG